LIGLSTSAFGRFAIAQGAAKVVIVGGGPGGATVAHYVKKGAPNLDVTLIEANPIYSSSFFSNLYLGGFRTLESLNHDYESLKKLGVNVVQDYATDVDTSGKSFAPVAATATATIASSSHQGSPSSTARSKAIRPRQRR